MVNAKYAWDNYTLYWSKSETTYGVPTNTTTNLAADVYYQFPMHHQNKIVVKRVRKKYHKHISGITDEGSTGNEGYEALEITLTGNMCNLDMLHFACKHCDNSGASSPYTHDTITSDPRLNTTSFPIIARQENSGADVLKLFTGCIVKNWWLDWEQGGIVQLSVVIELGREWTGFELTTWPQKPMNPFGPSELLGIWWKKATTEYDGYISRFHFEWNDRAKLDIYDIHPVDFSYGPRSVFIDFDFVSKYQTDWTDSQDKTNFDLHNRDIDFYIPLVKTAGNDEVLILMEKLCWIKTNIYPDFSHNEMYEKRKYTMGMDTDETDYKTTITIHDANEATRFT